MIYGKFSVTMKDGIDPQRVALRLRAVMADQDLETVSDFARYLGAERSQVSNWLQGYNLPPVHWMDALCQKRRGLTLDWVYKGVADAVPTALAIKLEALEQGMDVPVIDPPDGSMKSAAPRGSPGDGSIGRRSAKRKRAT